MALDSSNAVPSDTTRSLVLNPGQVSHSSTTNLISTQNSLIPPTVPHSTELSASVPPRAGFTPELPDTELRRLRAELASHAQSELINVPLEQRRRQQNVFKARTGPRAWESPLPTPTATQGASPNREIESGSDHRRTDGGTPRRDLAGRVVTAEGVVLGANLDRYSNGTVIGDSQNQNRGDRERTGHGDASHVMSFMQYGVRSETRNTGAAAVGGGTAGARGNGGNTPESEPRSADRGLVDDIAAAEGDADVPPAYEAEESSPGQDLKSPSGRMSLSPRNA